MIFLMALFIGQTAFFAAIHHYNDDLIRGRLDRSWIDEEGDGP